MSWTEYFLWTLLEIPLTWYEAQLKVALPTWTSDHNTTIKLNRFIHNWISEIQGYHDKGLLEIITSKINFLQQYARIQSTEFTSFHIPASVGIAIIFEFWITSLRATNMLNHLNKLSRRKTSHTYRNSRLNKTFICCLEKIYNIWDFSLTLYFISRTLLVLFSRLTKVTVIGLQSKNKSSWKPCETLHAGIMWWIS